VAPWWERRRFRELVPLFFALLLGALLGAGWAKVRGALSSAAAVFGGILGEAAVLGVLATSAVVVLARWPAAETPLDVTWLALAASAGMAAGGFAMTRFQAAQADPWLLVALPPLGAVVGAVWGSSLVWHKPWMRLGLFFVAAGSGGVALATTVFAARHVPGAWASWAAAFWWLLLGIAASERSDERLVRPQLAEEAGFGLLPASAVEAGSRFFRRCGRVLARRWDERKALAWLLVRLAACKAYLGRHGKKQSAAAVELGRLRERARRVFGFPADKVQSKLSA
jgi:hypothetical protein